MRNLFKFKSVKQRMIAGFSIVILLVVCLGTYNVWQTISNNNDAKHITEVELPLAMVDARYATNIAERIAASRGYVLHGGDFKNEFNRLTELGIKYEEFIRSIESTDEFNHLIEKTVAWREYIVDEVFAAYDSGNQELAMLRLDQSTEEARELMEGYQQLAESREAAIFETEERIIKGGEIFTIVGIVITALVIVMSIIVAIVTSNAISKPINQVMGRMTLIADGDLSNKDLEMTSLDEVGQLMTATNQMNNNMRGLLHQINEVSGIVLTQSEELTQSANEVKSGSEQIAITMQDLATASETEASSVGDISAGMGDFTSKVQHANESSENVQKNSDQVLKMTKEGSLLMKSSMEQMTLIDQVVQEAVQKVDGLDAHSKEISQLVAVIQDIANQTNLLALNAAIEASRAGEHGKGFAVVANEVRKLAEQSSESVTNITEIVTRIQDESSTVSESLQNGYKDVEQGTKQIEATGAMFNQISDSITETANNINVITDHLTDMASSSQQMNSSIQEIAAITEESSAAIEETAASTEQTTSIMEEVAKSSNHLAEMADQLNELVIKFKL